jgi:hypothetical protein
MRKMIVSPVRFMAIFAIFSSWRKLILYRVKSIVLNVHTPSEDNNDDINDIFDKELGYVFDQFFRYSMKNLWDNFNVKVDREVIFKLTVGSEMFTQN